MDDINSRLVCVVSLAIVHSSLTRNKISEPQFPAFVHLGDVNVLYEVQGMGKVGQV